MIPVPVLCRKLKGTQECKLFWNCSAIDPTVAYTCANLLHELTNKYDASPSQLVTTFSASIYKQCDLVDVVWNWNAWKKGWNVLSPSVELLSITKLALGPAVRIQRRLDLDQ